MEEIIIIEKFDVSIIDSLFFNNLNNIQTTIILIYIIYVLINSIIEVHDIIHKLYIHDCGYSYHCPDFEDNITHDHKYHSCIYCGKTITKIKNKWVDINELG